MDNRPIGVFDSGLGGLSAVKEIKKLLPNESIIYLGDTGRIPYGTRSKETIIKYASQDIAFLLKHNVKFILAACGTVSSNYVPPKDLPVPFAGVLAPLAKAAAKKTQNKKIGVIATSASVKSGNFEKQLKQENSSLEIFSVPCPLFVHLVENGLIDDGNQITELTAKMYLSSLKEKRIDTLILGCTHFPLIYNAIQKAVGDDVSLIDPGKEAAAYIKKTLEENSLLSDRKESPSYKYFVTDDVGSFNETAGIFLGETSLTNVSLAKIDESNIIL